jgi:hypothetical protein
MFDLAAAPYFTKDPYINHSLTESWSGNAILETCQYFLIKKFHGELSKKDTDRLWRVYDDANVKGKVGLLSRGSHKPNDAQAHDDYVGFAACAGIMEKVLAYRVYRHGKSHGWAYQIPGTTGFRNWFNAQFWRMPGVVQVIKMASREPLNFFDKLMLFFMFTGGIFSNSDSTSGRLLDWCVIVLYEHLNLDYALPNLGIKIWKSDIRRRYPNLIGDVFGIYYGREHVFAKFMLGNLTGR